MLRHSHVAPQPVPLYRLSPRQNKQMRNGGWRSRSMARQKGRFSSVSEATPDALHCRLLFMPCWRFSCCLYLPLLNEMSLYCTRKRQFPIAPTVESSVPFYYCEITSGRKCGKPSKTIKNHGTRGSSEDFSRAPECDCSRLCDWSPSWSCVASLFFFFLSVSHVFRAPSFPEIWPWEHCNI